MPRKIISQNSFSSGEITPRLYGRQDVPKYASAVKTATNVVLTGHGPLRRRNGTKYINEVKTSANETRLIKFQFSRGDVYIIEMGDQYFRFYKDAAVLGGPYEVAHPYTTAQIFEVTYVQFGNDIYFAHPSHAPRKLTRNGDTDWILSTVTFQPEPTVELGEFPATTVTPGATTGSGITFTAGAAVFEESDVGRRIINESGEGIANVTAYVSTTQLTCTITQDFPSTSAIASGDWKLDLSPVAELTPTGTAAGSIITVTADDIGTTSAIDTFRTGDVGRYILMSNGVLRIVSRTNASTVVCEVLKTLDNDDETAFWTLEDAAWDGTRGYPRAVGIHSQRLWYASTTAQPQTLWGSEVGIFDGFGVGANDSDSIAVTISSGQVNQVNWMADGRDLILGTSAGENTVSSGSSSAISPSSVTQQPRTRYGSLRQQPVIVGEEILFVQSSQRKIRSFRYDFGLDGYIGEDLTFLSEHITEGLVKTAAYAQEPDNIIYAILENGDMLSGVYIRDQQVIGWAKHTTDGDYEDVETISNGSVDEVWVLVKRTINGTTKRYIELFETGDGTDYTHGLSDSFTVYSDPKTITSITSADPGVVTCGTHGYSNGDKVKLIGVGGMTEVENTAYVVANKTATTFELESDEPLTGISTATYQWTASGSGTDEYYLELSGGGDPSISTSIISLYENESLLTPGTAGSLAASEWDYTDNDTLGYNTLYVRLAGGEDPDTKGTGWVAYAMGIDTSGFTAYTSGGEAHKLVTSVTGLTYLEGKELSIRADGGTHSPKTVSSGSVTLDDEHYEVVVGLPYTTTIELLNLEYDVGLGTMQAQRSRTIRVVPRVYQSIIPTIDGESLPTRDPTMNMDTVPPLYSGDLEYASTTWGDKIAPLITSSDPLPMQITSMYIVLEGNVK